MTAPFPPSPAIDLLNEAIRKVRSHFDRSIPVADRLKNFGPRLAAARDLAAADAIEAEFHQLACGAGLAAKGTAQ